MGGGGLRYRSLPSFLPAGAGHLLPLLPPLRFTTTCVVTCHHLPATTYLPVSGCLPAAMHYAMEGWNTFTTNRGNSPHGGRTVPFCHATAAYLDLVVHSLRVGGFLRACRACHRFSPLPAGATRCDGLITGQVTCLWRMPLPCHHHPSGMILPPASRTLLGISPAWDFDYCTGATIQCLRTKDSPFCRLPTLGAVECRLRACS